MIDLIQNQLLTQARFMLAQRVDATANRRDLVAQVEVEALDKGCVDLPAIRGPRRAILPPA
jgi:hypothetical protein